MTTEISVLPNGLRVCTDPMSSVESVSLGVWVDVGARHETPDINGVAHLVEHMLFKGTPRRSAAAISEQIEDVGGILNAYTTREQTAYYAKVLREDSGLALDILSDILQHATLDNDELTKERTVVIQEIGQAIDTPDDIIYDYAQTTAYAAQPLGLPVLGTPEIVSSVPRSALTNYISRHYTAPKMVLAAAGAIEHETLVEMASEFFADLPPANDVTMAPAEYVGGDYREERDLEQLHVIMGFQSVSYHHPAYHAHSILSTLLGGGMSSRLFQEVREKRGLVYSINSFNAAFVDDGFFGIYAGTDPEHAKTLMPVICDEILKVASDVTDAEIARARAQMRAGMLMGQESTMARCENLGQCMLIHGRPIETEETLEKLAAVDAAAVREAVEFLLARPLTMTALGALGDLESYDKIEARLRRG